MSQKSRFKMQTQGVFEFRKTFPQLPWGTLTDPAYIQTAHGWVSFSIPFVHDTHRTRYSNRLLVDGWWRYSRKPVGFQECNDSCWVGMLTSFTELCRRLDYELHLGCGDRLRFSYPVLLLRLLHRRSHSPLWTWFRTVCWSLSWRIMSLIFNSIVWSCAIKYGKDWERYCSIVKYKFIPGIYWKALCG